SEHLRRSLRCGVVAQALSRHGGYPVPEEAYLLGMFSNIGMLWLGAHYPSDLEEAAALLQTGAADSIEDAVSRTLGVSPAAIAARVLEQWNLPTTYAGYFQRQAARAPGAGPAAAAPPPRPRRSPRSSRSPPPAPAGESAPPLAAQAAANMKRGPSLSRQR